jgi:hypothetical protein
MWYSLWGLRTPVTSTIIAERKGMLSLSVSPCHDHELTSRTSTHQVQHTPCTTNTEYSIHPVQYTPSTAYTQYSIHPVQHTPSTAYTQDCASSLHSRDYKMTLDCSFSFQHAYLHNRLPSASSPWELKVTLRHSHISSQLTDELSFSTWCAIHWPPPSTWPISLNHSIQSVSPGLHD